MAFFVIPAEDGIQKNCINTGFPPFAGMTKFLSLSFLRKAEIQKHKKENDFVIELLMTCL